MFFSQAKRVSNNKVSDVLQLPDDNHNVIASLTTQTTSHAKMMDQRILKNGHNPDEHVDEIVRRNSIMLESSDNPLTDMKASNKGAQNVMDRVRNRPTLMGASVDQNALKSMKQNAPTADSLNKTMPISMSAGSIIIKQPTVT